MPAAWVAAIAAALGAVGSLANSGKQAPQMGAPPPPTELYKPAQQQQEPLQAATVAPVPAAPPTATGQIDLMELLRQLGGSI